MASKDDDDDKNGDDGKNGDDEKPRRKKKRWKIGVPVAVVLIIIVAAVVVVSSKSTKTAKEPASPSGPLSGVASSRQLLDGVPQSGATLGKPSAPATLYVFDDLQCRQCAEFELNVFPGIVRRYVRAGKLKVVFRQLPTLTGSVKAASAAAAAGRQDKLWSYADVWYRNQGKPESGYVGDTFIVKVAHGVQGLDTPRFERARTAPVTPLVNQAFAQAKRFRITAAPAFVLQKGATQELVHWQTLTNLEFDAPIEAILRNG